ncbi:MAG: hypothetical protein ACJA1C_002548 [Crocinitomicaceae bacterium]|jgi:hypothetical protein
MNNSSLKRIKHNSTGNRAKSQKTQFSPNKSYSKPTIKSVINMNVIVKKGFLQSLHARRYHFYFHRTRMVCGSFYARKKQSQRLESIPM